MPAGSSPTAEQFIGCTNEPGSHRRNVLVEADLPGLGSVEGADTRLRTFRDGDAWVSRSVAGIARLVLPTEGGTLELFGIKSTAVASLGTDPHSEARTTVLDATFTAPGAAPQRLAVPSPGQPLVVPGVLTVSLDHREVAEGTHKAKAANDGLLVQLLLTGTSLQVAHARAVVYDGLQQGIFNGRSTALEARGLQDHAETGRQPLSLMPCQGTAGRMQAKHVATVRPGDDLVVHGLTTEQKARGGGQSARGFERASVAHVDLGDGDLVVDAVVGQANAVRRDGTLHRSTRGTTIGRITTDGARRTFPAGEDVLEIPGVARLERGVVHRIRHGIAVTALRITVLDGSGAVIELGQAAMRIGPGSRG